MSTSPIKLFIDTAQNRLKEDAISTLVTGCDWDPATISDVWIEPASRTAMLLPAVLDGANWSTSTSGIYSKWRLSDYSSLTDSSNWEEHSPDLGGPFIRYKSSNTGGLSGGVSLPGINTPVVVEYFGGTDTNSARGELEIGWGATADFGVTGVGLRFFGDGKVQVWKSGLQVGEGSLSAKKEYVDAILGNQAQNVKNRYVTILLIPLHDRALLIASTQGGAFIHTFEDLVDGSAGQTIVPGGKIWFNVPAPISAQGIRIAKLQYKASGIVYGRPSSWRLPSAGRGTLNKKIYQSVTEGALGLVTLDAVARVWSPYTTSAMIDPVQLKLALTRGSGGQTPFVYGARAWYDPQVASTTAGGTGSGVDAIAAGGVRRFNFEFGDVESGHRGHVTMTRPAGMNTAGIPKLLETVNRPVAIDGQGGHIFQGVFRAPKWKDRNSSIDQDSAQQVDFEIESIWKFAERFRFSDPIPLDSYSLGDAYRLVAKTIGLDVPLVSTSADSVPLGNTGVKHGEDGFNLIIEVGDSGADWLRRLHETFAANWFHGIDYSSGTPKLVLKEPSDMPSSVSVSIYRTLADAVAGGAASDQKGATKFVYTSHNRDFLEPEANDVWIMGMDYRTMRPIIVHKRDSASADPTTAPASRPANWMGGLYKCGLIDGGLPTYAQLDRAMSCFFPRVTARRELHEWECQRLPGVKVGDLVTLKGAAPDGTDVTVRIKTFGFDVRTAFDVDTAGTRTTGGINVENAHYVGEAGPLVCPIGVPGTTIAQIKRNHEFKVETDRAKFEGAISQALKRIPFFVSLGS